MSNSMDQIVAITSMNVRNMSQRAASSIVALIGIAGVVTVLIGVLSIAEGFKAVLDISGSDQVAIVLRNGSAAENGSVLTRDAVRLISDGTGVKRDLDGKPIVSAEGLRLLNMHKQQDGTEVNVALRGVGEKFQALRPEFKIIEGRLFSPAVNEVVVGKAAHAQFKGLNIGDKITTRNATWTVVGVFSSSGDSQ